MNTMIYDCFTFFNELDLLEIRLNILNQVVDYFVLVEASKTHTNQDKSFVYEDNKERFEKFHHKIIHIKVDDFPTFTGDTWVLENYQRNAILRGLTNCRHDDFIMISDLDEIPSPEAINLCKSRLSVYFFKQRFYSFFLNMRIVNEHFWNGTVMVPYSRLTTPDDIRTCRRYFKKKHTICVLKKYFYLFTFNRSKYKKWSIASKGQIKGSVEVENGGWHFSYCGDVNSIVYKLQSYAHQEFNTTTNTDPAIIRKMIEDKVFCFRDKSAKLESVPIDDTFPIYINNNIDKYRHLVYCM